MSEVARLREAQLGEAVDVMTTAFADDPIAEMFFSGNPSDTEKLRRWMWDISISARLEAGVPIPAAFEKGKLVGLALISVPDIEYWTDEVEAEWLELEAEAGPESELIFSMYEELHEQNTKQEPQIYLVAIGVMPEHQGKGHGKRIIEEVARIAKDAGYSGVGLDTGNEANVALYQRCGFEVFSQAKLDETPLWFMYRQI